MRRILLCVAASLLLTSCQSSAPGFYAFDICKRFTGPELSKLVADAHRSGRTIQWSIGPLDARVDCDTAARRAAQYSGWGKGKRFGAGKVEFHAGAGFTCKGLGGPQPDVA